MIPNFLVVALTALIPLVLGFIWYNPKVFGKAWMKASGLTEESMKGANMALIFGLTYVFSLFLALILNVVVIHQYHIYSILMNEPGMGEEGSDIMLYIQNFMDQYGNNFRSFKHGALHGGIAGILFALPIIAINALFEHRGFKYIAINAGFWIACLILMGGVLCAYA